jgi:preprotein translocase subunit SecY
VLLCAIQGYFIAVGLEGWGQTTTGSAVIHPGMLFRITTVVTMIGGTMFLMWLGEQVTARGIGNGISLVILAGIVAVLPTTTMQVWSMVRTGALPAVGALAILAAAAGFVLAIVFVELSQRRLPVQYPKGRGVGQAPSAGEASFLPLKVNTAGVIPPIFASSLLLLPATLMGFLSAARPADLPAWASAITAQLQHGRPLFMLLSGGMIMFFTFFYTAIVFNAVETADNLRKFGGFLPGVRPGRQTAEYLDQVLGRLTVIGASYITLVCLLPEWLIGAYNLPFYLGGTSLLIVVSVTIDLLTQTQAHLVAHQYTGMLRKVRQPRPARAATAGGLAP